MGPSGYPFLCPTFFVTQISLELGPRRTKQRREIIWATSYENFWGKSLKLVEIVKSASDPLRLAFRIQRKHLVAAGYEFESLDIGGMSPTEVQKHLKEAAPDAILARGFEGVPIATNTFPQTPLFVDVCTLSTVTKRDHFLVDVLRRSVIFCHGLLSEEMLRGAGIYKLVHLAHPITPLWESTDTLPNEIPIVGILNTGSDSMRVVNAVKSMAAQQGWKLTLVTSFKHAAARVLDSDMEVAEVADLVVAPTGHSDLGQINDGALLATAFRKPLITTKTSSMCALGFPPKNFLPAQMHSLGSYAVAVGIYCRNRVRMDAWDGKVSEPDIVAHIARRLNG